MTRKIFTALLLIVAVLLTMALGEPQQHTRSPPDTRARPRRILPQSSLYNNSFLTYCLHLGVVVKIISSLI